MRKTLAEIENYKVFVQTTAAALKGSLVRLAVVLYFVRIQF